MTKINTESATSLFLVVMIFSMPLSHGLLRSTYVPATATCASSTTNGGTQAGNGGSGGDAESGGLVQTGNTSSNVNTTHVVNATIVRIGR